MKILTKVLAISAISMASMSASAELIGTDWKADGDKLATLETVSGIEWLDLTQTIGKSINDVQELLDTTFAGWRLPRRVEVKYRS